MRTRIKICCISSPVEAALAIAAGADALGLVARMPSGPGPISDELIFEISRKVPPPVATFLLTSETEAAAVVRHWQRVKTNTIQFVDALKSGSYEEIRRGCAGVRLVQVIHVLDEKSVDEALAAAENVDALLLDSGNPNLAVKELGGTGRMHDWSFSKKIVEKSPIPVFLAGGLKPENARRAIEEVGPFGLDLCSGVRTDGRLDARKLEAII